MGQPLLFGYKVISRCFFVLFGHQRNFHPQNSIKIHSFQLFIVATIFTVTMDDERYERIVIFETYAAMNMAAVPTSWSLARTTLMYDKNRSM